MNVFSSGRFDPPHAGHICNLRRIAKKYPGLQVFILDHPGRRFPAVYCKRVLEEALEGTGIKFLLNEKHFMDLKDSDMEVSMLKREPNTIYCGGNLEVLQHIRELGVKIDYFERAYHFSASQVAGP